MARDPEDPLQNGPVVNLPPAGQQPPAMRPVGQQPDNRPNAPPAMRPVGQPPGPPPGYFPRNQ
jgi:hypothetical protein